MSVPHKWDNIPLSPAQPSKGTPVPPLRESNPPSVLRPVLVLDHSQSPPILLYLRYVLGNPNHLDMAPSTTQTVISCIINIVSQCSSGTQAHRARTPRRSLRRHVARFTRSSFKKPVIMCHESRTSPSRTQVIQTLPSCSTRTPSSLTQQSWPFTRLRQERTRGVWQLLWFGDSCVVLPCLALPRSLSALYTSTMLWPRNATPPLTCSGVSTLA